MFDFFRQKEIPTFNEYFPSMESMDKSQKKFYNKVRKEIGKNNYIDVNGNISYLFLYLYEILEKHIEKDLDALYEELLKISETYISVPKVSEYCMFWANDCLLAKGNLEKFLDNSEPKNPFGSAASQSDTRLNIQNHLKQQANIIDLVLLRNGRKNKLLLENEAAYKDYLVAANQQYIESNGEWFEKLIKELGDNPYRYKHSLFNGSRFSGAYELDINMYTFYKAESVINEIKNITRDAENLLRDNLKVPRIGEGWVSETRLYRHLSEFFPQTLVIQHGRPSWLGRQHFDIWFPKWSVAVEYHGKQHFEPVEFFGGEEAFKKNVERDKRKINLSRRHGVKLFVVTEDDNFEDIAISIKQYVSNKNA